jgi:hypothetical protein
VSYSESEEKTETYGENALTPEEVGVLISEALEALRSKGVTSAVLIALVDDVGTDYCRIGYRGSTFAARGMIGWAMDWIRSETSPEEEKEAD